MDRNIDDIARYILSLKESNEKLMASISTLDGKTELLQHTPKKLTKKMRRLCINIGLKQVTGHTLTVVNKSP